jgi:hypothetical protein
MNIRGQRICGIPAIAVRNLFRAFNNLPTPVLVKKGKLTHQPNVLTDQFVADTLRVCVSCERRCDAIRVIFILNDSENLG